MTGKLLTPLLLILILMVAVFFRFWSLDSTPPGLYPDEAVNGINALEAAESGSFRVFYPDNNGREGLYINIQALALDMFGVSVKTLRGVSAFFGVLVVFGLFFFTKLLWGVRIALVASYLTAVSFWAVNFSRIGFRAIVLPAILVWSFYFLWLGMRKKKTWAVVLAGIIFGVGMHTYISFRISPLLLIILFVLLFFVSRPFSRRELIRWGIVFFVGFIVTASPLLLYYIQNPSDFLGRAGQVSIFAEDSPFEALGEATAKTLAMFNFVGDFNWRHNFAGRPLLFWPVGIGFLVGIIILFGRLKKRSATHDHFLLAWFFVLLIPNFLAPEGAPHALRALGALPVVFIISALGLDYIWRKIIKHVSLIRLRRELGALAILVLVFIGVWESRVYFVKWALEPRVAQAFDQRLADIGQFLNSSSAEHKYVIINEGGTLVDGVHIPSRSIEFVAWPIKSSIIFINGGDIENKLPGELPASSVVILSQKDSALVSKLNNKYTNSRSFRALTLEGIRVP